MAATRLSDSQKQELVERYRQGASSQSLAEAFDCSPNTVSRVVKAALDPSTYAELKQLRARGASLSVNEPPAPAPEPVAPDTTQDLDDEDGGEDPHRVLAIDDADDFAEDNLEDAELEGEEEGDPFDASEFVTVPVTLAIEDRPPTSAQPLHGAELPSSVYLLVDKTVELQARPLKEFPELGPLPSEELERQALVVFANPRQAKRQCGRSQRVIKVPDSGVLERTAPYLLSQGISRLVLEGALYALPGS
jgi:hypothetical protein